MISQEHNYFAIIFTSSIKIFSLRIAYILYRYIIKDDLAPHVNNFLQYFYYKKVKA